VEKLLGSASNLRYLKLSKHRRARVWIDLLPDILYPPLRIFNFDLPIETDGAARDVRGAIELLIPEGPKLSYGLLGGTFDATTTEGFKVDIWTSSGGPIYSSGLLSNLDTAVAGLNEEYLSGVVEGLQSSSKMTNTLGTGHLVINCASHAMAYSNKRIFTRLARLLLGQFSLAGKPTDGELTEMFENYLEVD
jgi:hypothetical protein